MSAQLPGAVDARRGVDRLRRWAGLPLLWAIRFYQRVISPWTVSSCRFYPSCSQYAYDAVRLHGPVRGSWLAVRRLGRCHPWTPGGVDHVPAPQGHVPTDTPTPTPLSGA